MDSSDDEFIANLMDLDAAIMCDSTNHMEFLSTPSTPNDFNWNFDDEVNPGRPNQHFHDRNMLKFCITKTPAMFYRLFR